MNRKLMTILLSNFREFKKATLYLLYISEYEYINLRGRYFQNTNSYG